MTYVPRGRDEGTTTCTVSVVDGRAGPGAVGATKNRRGTSVNHAGRNESPVGSPAGSATTCPGGTVDRTLIVPSRVSPVPFVTVTVAANVLASTCRTVGVTQIESGEGGGRCALASGPTRGRHTETEAAREQEPPWRRTPDPSEERQRHASPAIGGHDTRPGRR